MEKQQKNSLDAELVFLEIKTNFVTHDYHGSRSVNALFHGFLDVSRLHLLTFFSTDRL